MRRLLKVVLNFRLLLAVTVHVALLGHGTGWAAENRVALVIGNGAYQKVPALPNPPRDASDVADALQQLGFNVTRLIDGDLAQMNKALSDFTAAAAHADTAIVFYAGHGIEAAGENWLIPVDAEITSDADASKRAISLHQVQKLVDKTTGLGLVILDACRDNPFVMKLAADVPAAAPGAAPSTTSRSLSHGLAPTYPTGNVLIAFSAKDGTTAEDGSGRNSPFTSALLHHIGQSGLEVTFLFRIVRDEVMKATNGVQQPFAYGSLSKEAIYLMPPSGDQILATMPTIAPETRPANPLFSADDAKRVEAFAHDKRFNMPIFQIDAIADDVPDTFRTFVGVWVSKIGSGNSGMGRQVMLIVSHINKDGVASGYLVFGPPTPRSWNQSPSKFRTFKTKVAGDGLHIALGKSYDLTIKPLDQARFFFRSNWSSAPPTTRSIRYGGWSMPRRARPPPTPFLTSLATPELPQASAPSRQGTHYGHDVGDISNGACRCKTLCDTGQSRFSSGRTVSECKAQCQISFSGCTRGEARSNARRD